MIDSYARMLCLCEFLMRCPAPYAAADMLITFELIIVANMMKSSICFSTFFPCDLSFLESCEAPSMCPISCPRV